jgi:hypothetical protein
MNNNPSTIKISDDTKSPLVSLKYLNNSLDMYQKF